MSILTRYGGALLTSPFSRNELWRKARAVPSLDLRFADSKSLVDAISGQNLVTFTRASSATYVGADGLIKTAAVDEPRFDHNPTTGESLGLLVEEQRTNLLLRSAEFDNSAWFKNATTVSANAITAPDGTLTADLIVESTASSQHSVDLTITFVQGTTYTASVYAKQGPGSRFLTLNIAGGAPGATFNLSAQTFVTNAGGQTNVSAAIKPLANGWFFCSLTWTQSLAFTTSQVRVSLSNNSASGGQTTYTGDGTSGMYVWGAQLEVGAFPTSYIPTTTATVTRSADVASITGSNFSSRYRQDEGTLYAQYIRRDTRNRFSVGMGYDDANYIAIGYGNSVNQDTYIQPLTANINVTSPPINTLTRSVVSYNSLSGAASINGSIVEKSAVGALPSGSNGALYLGSSPFSTSSICTGTIASVLYFSRKLPNSSLQEMTR